MKTNKSKINPIRRFSFKSKTLEGATAKFELTLFDNEVILLTKIIVSTKTEIPNGFEVVKSFTKYKVLVQHMSLKKDSLFRICQEIFKTK